MEGPNDSDGDIEGVTEQEIPDQLDERLFKVPDLAKGAVELPKSYCDDVHVRWDLDSINDAFC